MKLTLSSFLLVSSLLGFATELRAAEEPDDKGIFNIVYENDLLAGDGDSEYTNGIRLSWLSSEAGVSPLINDFANNLLPIKTDGKKRISLAIGQSIFTPDNLETTALIREDRPYAGWLYGSIGIVSDTGAVLDNAMLTIGVIGPASGAEATQKFIHDVISSPYPQGWDNQLDNELGINLTFERKWRNMYQFAPFGIAVDATPNIGVNLGNVNTDASIGSMFRLGYDLPADYGPPRIRPSLPGSDFFIPTKELSGYLFAGFEGRAVARNIFLDGNTFSSSHHVDKENFVGSVQLGAAATFDQWRLSYTYVLVTEEFEGQDRPQRFGAITLSYRF